MYNYSNSDNSITLIFFKDYNLKSVYIKKKTVLGLINIYNFSFCKIMSVFWDKAKINYKI